MKAIQSISTLFLIGVLSLLSCKKDPCDTIVCTNGYCVNGACDCFPGYSGPSCGNEDRPIKITLNKIVLTTFSQTNPQGGGWDPNGTGPDIYVDVYSGAILNYSSDYVLDAVNTNQYTFTPPSPISMITTETITIRLFDYESFGNDTQMSAITTSSELWEGYLKGAGFPSSTIFNFGPTSYTLYWTYTHN